MNDKRLLIYGAGGQGREVLELARQVDTFEEIVFVNDIPFPDGVNGVPVYSWEEIRAMPWIGEAVAVVANGEPRSVRAMTARVKQNGIALTSLVHPSVHVPRSTRIEPGAIVQDRVFLGPNMVLEEGCYLNYNGGYGHDVTIGAYVNISMGCMIGGHVSIGADTYIGMRTAVRDTVSVGTDCIIGMGSCVTKDIPDHVVAYGNPCRVVRENRDGRVFG